jgi:biotin carboxylase
VTGPRVLILGGRPGILAKAVACGLRVVNIQKPADRDEVAGQPSIDLRLADYQDVPAVTRLVERLHQQEPFARVLTQTESAVLVACFLTSRLGLPGNSYQVARTFHDKRLLRTLLNERGLGVVPAADGRTSKDVTAFAATHGGCVVKPPMASGSLGVQKITSAAQARQAAAWIESTGLAEFLIEGLLTGEEISVESFSAAGRHHVIALTGKHTGAGVIELGHVVPAPVPEGQAAAAARLTRQMLTAAGVTDGPAHTEIILTRDGPRIVEAHVRRAGDRITDLIERVYGVDLELAAYQLAAGTLELPARLTARGAAAMRFLTPAPGLITAVSGADRARRAAGVFGVRVDAETGATVGPLRWSGDRQGYVMAVGADARAAVLAARRAAGLIRIETSSAGAVQAPAAGTVTEMLAAAGEVADPFASPAARALAEELTADREPLAEPAATAARAGESAGRVAGAGAGA